MASCSQKSAAEANLLGKRKPKDGLETKSILKRHKEKSEEKEQIEGSVELSERKSDEAKFPISSQVMTDFLPSTYFYSIHFFKDVGDVVSVRLIVNHEGKHVCMWAVALLSLLLLTKQIGINFFKDVGEVVHVRLIVNPKCRLAGFGYVEFASANEAEKALKKKKGEYLHNREIDLCFAKTDADPSDTKYCIDHKVWYEERESLVIEDAADESPDFVEDVALRKKTVFLADLSMKNGALCSIQHIRNFFKDVGEVVRVRLCVDHWGEHAGCCFVEFASANEANKAVQEKQSKGYYNLLLNVAEMDRPYPFRPKYKLAEKLWYEDNLRREGFGLTIKSKLREAEPTIFCGKKIALSDKV